MSITYLNDTLAQGYSYVEYTADGTDPEFQFAFSLGYLNDFSLVNVYVNNERVDSPYDDLVIEPAFEFVDAGTIRFLAGFEPVDGDGVLIRRIVNKDELRHEFGDGAIMTGDTLDESQLQLMFAVHEQLDGFTLGEAGQRSDLNMQNYKIVNLGEGTEDSDAVTYGQTRTLVDESTALRDETQQIHDDTAALVDSAQNARDYAWEWATSDDEVEDGIHDPDFSAKFYADSARYDADRAQAAANVAGAQVGELRWYFTDHINPIDRPGMVMPLGQLLSKTGIYRNLWDAVDSGQQPVVTEAQWQAGQKGCFVDYDDDYFRIPHIGGQFIRVPGEADPDFATRLAGAIQGDAVGPIDTTVTNTLSAASDGTHAHTLSGTAASGGAHGHTGSAASAGTHSHSITTNSPGTGTITIGSMNPVTSIYTDGALALPAGNTAVAAGAHSHSVSIDAGGAHEHSLSGSAASNGAHTHSIEGDIAVSIEPVSASTETRPTNMYLQPYLVYSQNTAGVGITLRGAWDANLNVISGDALNTALVKGVPPVTDAGIEPNGMGYVVVVAGSMDLTNEVGEETFAVGDRVVWVGDETTGSWVQLRQGGVSTVNGMSDDVIVSADNSPVLESAPLGETILEYIDRKLEEQADALFPIGKVIFELAGTDPNTVYPGTWTLMTGAASRIGFGDGSAQTGASVGSNSYTLTNTHLPAHSHTFSGGTAASAGAHQHVGGAPVQRSTSAYYPYGSQDNVSLEIFASGTTGTRPRALTSSTGAHTHSVTGTISSAGAGEAMSLLGAQTIMNVWKRTA